MDVSGRLKLRYYRSEGTIRSVGDHPNGVLAVDTRADGGAQWVISPTLQPGSRRLGGPLHGASRAVLLDDELDPVFEVDTPAVVRACDSDATRSALLEALSLAIASSAQLVKHSPEGLLVVEAAVALARETVDEALATGWA